MFEHELTGVRAFDQVVTGNRACPLGEFEHANSVPTSLYTYLTIRVGSDRSSSMSSSKFEHSSMPIKTLNLMPYTCVRECPARKFEHANSNTLPTALYRCSSIRAYTHRCSSMSSSWIRTFEHANSDTLPTALYKCSRILAFQQANSDTLSTALYRCSSIRAYADRSSNMFRSRIRARQLEQLLIHVRTTL